MQKSLTKRILHLDFVPCHRMESRSFIIRGKKFPICARCASILLGYLATPVLFGFHLQLPLWIGMVFNFPMLLDGYTQLKKWRTSNNMLRFLTGLGAGFGQAVLVTTTAFSFINWLSSLPS